MAAKPKKFAMTKAKMNKANTRHGKMDMPFKPTGKKVGYAEGGEVSFKEAFAAARKEKGAGKTFTWRGKSYTTDRADDKPKGASLPPNRMKVDTSEKAVTARAREELKPTPKAPPNSLARKPAPAGIAKDAAPDSRLSGVKSTFAAGREKPKSYFSNSTTPGERMGMTFGESAPTRNRKQAEANEARKKLELPTKRVGPGWAKGGSVRGGGLAKRGVGRGKMC